MVSCAIFYTHILLRIRRHVASLRHPDKAAFRVDTSSMEVGRVRATYTDTER